MYCWELCTTPWPSRSNMLALPPAFLATLVVLSAKEHRISAAIPGERLEFARITSFISTCRPLPSVYPHHDSLAPRVMGSAVCFVL